MTTPGTGVMRLVRAAVLGTLVLVLTLSAHRLGGGDTPGMLGIVALALVVWPVALLSTRRRLRPAALVAGLGAGQLVGHGLLGWLGGSAGASVSLGCLQHAAHRAGSGGCLGEAATAAATAGHGSTHSDAGLLMVAAHVGATVLAALLVARGEQILWRVLDLVVRALPALLAPVEVHPRPAAAALLVPARADLEVRTGRGPPAYAA